MKKRIWIVAVVAVCVAGVGVYFARTRTQPPPAITTVAITRGDVVETVDATGHTPGRHHGAGRNTVSGTIKALHVDFNTTVRRGQIVASWSRRSLKRRVVGPSEISVWRCCIRLPC